MSSPPLYLIDANVLIDAARDYYPLDQVPEFWEWLVEMGRSGRVKIPHEIYDEVCTGDGDLPTWLRDPEAKKALLLDEEADTELVRRVIDEGYAPDLNDQEIEEIGRDPFLIAYALADIDARRVVTGEVSKPKKERQNRKVPNVCRSLGVTCKKKFQLTSELRFSTNWKSQSR